MKNAVARRFLAKNWSAFSIAPASSVFAGLLAFLLLAPLPALAQVVISEIMYDPAGADSGREWVELYNPSGSDVAIVGGTVKGSWRISDGSNHTLVDPSADPPAGGGRGSLVVPVGGYLIIASDPSTFIGEYPEGTYSVVKSSISLNNTGATVSLIDGSGAVVDSVAYSKDEGGYDDGTSLQRALDGSWIAALPTPGSDNAAPSSVSSGQTASTTQEQTSPQSAGQSSGPMSSYVPPPVTELFADAGGDRAAIVGADVEFDGRAYDRLQHPLDPATTRFSWNFGDGSTAEGAAVLHRFDYPGRYAVVLSIAQNKDAAADTITVTAEPAALSFNAPGDGSVSIQNLAGRVLDLSRWIVRASGGAAALQFILPEHSLLLSGSAMRISAATLGFGAGSDVLLEYPNGVPVVLQQNAATSSAPAAVPQAAIQPKAPPSSAAPPENVIAAPAEAAPQADPIASTSPNAQTAAAAAALPGGWVPWAQGGAIALVLAGAAVLYRFWARPKEEPGGWNIIEEEGD